MVSDLTAVSPRHGYKVLLYIWFTMIIFFGVFALTAFLVPLGEGEPVPSIMAALAAGVLSGGLFAVQLRLRRNVSDENMFPRVLDLDSWGLSEDAAERLKGLRVPERGAQLILQAHVVFSIITWALAEVVGIMGLILTFLTGETRFMAVFGGIALLELLYFRPRQADFERQLERWGKYIEAHRGQASMCGAQD